MVRWRFLFAILVVLLARPAWSARLVLGWGDSPADGGLTAVRFDCLSNTGDDVIVLSYVPDQDLVGVTGWHAELATLAGFGTNCDPFSAQDDCGPYGLPRWWDFSAGACREHAARIDADFTGEPYASATSVSDPWRGRAAFAPGSGTWTIEVRTTTSLGSRQYTVGRCGLEASLPPGESVDLPAGREVYLARIVVDHRLSAGADACFGCCEPAAVLATGEVRCGAQAYATPTSPPLLWLGDLGCAPVPAIGSSWGRLKSVYR